MPPIEEGEFLVKNVWMSVDPYMRDRMKDSDSYVLPFQIDQALERGCIGKVLESDNANFAEGDYVLGNLGWREYWKSSGQGDIVIDPDLARVQAYLGALGMTGKIAKLKPGSTVFVSVASGAVGLIVCQLAKAKGCKVIGSAGKRSKIDWLLDKAGIDACINDKETKHQR